MLELRSAEAMVTVAADYGRRFNYLLQDVSSIPVVHLACVSAASPQGSLRDNKVSCDFVKGRNF